MIKHLIQKGLTRNIDLGIDLGSGSSHHHLARQCSISLRPILLTRSLEISACRGPLAEAGKMCPFTAKNAWSTLTRIASKIKGFRLLIHHVLHITPPASFECIHQLGLLFLVKSFKRLEGQKFRVKVT